MTTLLAKLGKSQDSSFRKARNPHASVREPQISEDYFLPSPPPPTVKPVAIVSSQSPARDETTGQATGVILKQPRWAVKPSTHVARDVLQEPAQVQPKLGRIESVLPIT